MSVESVESVKKELYEHKSFSLHSGLRSGKIY